MSRKAAKQTQPRRFLSSREPDQTPLQVSTPIMPFFASQPQPTPAPLEVRCAGCGETLEVEPGLTQFVCPDCHTAQALPPELMPRKRKALPLTRPLDSGNPIQLSCGGCGLLLTLPPPSSLGTTFAFPRCGAALALPLDHHQFRAYQASVDTSSPSAPSAVRLPPPNWELQIRFPSYGGVNRTVSPALTPVPSTTHANSNAAFFHTNTTIPPSVSPVPPPRNGARAAIRPAPSPSSLRNEAAAAIHSTISPVQPRNATNATICPTNFPVPPLTETCTGIRPTNSSDPPRNEASTIIPPESTPVLRPRVRTNMRKRQRITAKQQDSLPAPSIPPSVNFEQVEKEVGPTLPLTNIPTSKRSKRAKKQPAVLTTSVPSSDDEEPLLRRSTRLANLPAKCNMRKKAPISKKKKQKSGTSLSDKNVPDQSEHNVSHHEPAPQDVAMHDNDLFSADSGEPLTDAFRQHLDTLVNLSSSLYVNSNLRSESPAHPGSGLHVQPDQTPEPHLSPALDDTVSGQHRDQSPNDYTGQADALSNDEGDDLDDAEEYYSHSDPELAGLQTLGAHNRNGANPGTCRKERCRTQDVDLWSSSDNDPVEIKFNHLGQPVGKEATMLTRLLCTISRDGRLAPLNFTDWRAVPNDCKITIWSLVKSKFKVEEINKKIIMRALGRHWNRWKYTLKQLHYDTHDNDEERLADIDERIQPEQWPFLVQFWSSEEFQKRSAVGKASRSSMKMLHTTGSKSFAQIREEERLKRPNKEEPSRAEMFILTHTRKDGTPIDEEAAIIIARLREELKNAPDPNNTDAQDDILAKVLHETNNPSLFSCYGLLPQDPRHVRKPDLTEPSSEDKARIIAEARRLADEETKPMREKMDEMAKRHEEMEQRHKDMVEEMNRMRSTMMAMQQLVAARDNMGSV